MYVARNLQYHNGLLSSFHLHANISHPDLLNHLYAAMPENSLSRRKGSHSGPETSPQGIPYDYIVIIDAGSKGLRVYVYNWLNPQHALAAGMDFQNALNSLKLVRDSGKTHLVLLPGASSHKKWHKKIKPGVSAFSQGPHKIGKHHIKPLLQLASSVVPKSQHYRTPIFLHSTGGMRLLQPNEQQLLLENICLYLTQKSDFYVPECESHVNMIDGDVEGLYGWLSINSLIGALDHPDDHAHGKNHTTYGLLDMGGASTQVVFVPNTTEIAEHQNNLYHVSLVDVPQLEGTSYATPIARDFDIYLDSFLGYGMYQAHTKYLTFLTEAYREAHHLDSGYYRYVDLPVPDPCLPKGYTTKAQINGHNVDFTGESDFEKCMKSIFPVLSNTTHTEGLAENGNCKQFSEGGEVSACLLNELIPSFDFDVNHFVGVSGYWDALTNLLSYQLQLPPVKHGSKDDTADNKTDTYDYKVIYRETSNLCSESFQNLIELNSLREDDDQVKEDDLAELCFKSSWILNFLHFGLGFPRFGIDEVPVSSNEFKSLQLVETLGGSDFTWTLGRAILYANDEYVQAYNNYTAKKSGLGENDALEETVKRPGYYYTAMSGTFNYGAERDGISPRPEYRTPPEGAKYTYYDYETTLDTEDLVLKWYIQPHRWYGMFIFVFLMGFIVWLMAGRGIRAHIAGSVSTKLKNSCRKVSSLFKREKAAVYSRVPVESSTADLENNFELDNMASNKATESPLNLDDRFMIGSDEE